MPATQAANLWTPTEVMALITLISTVFLAALGATIVQVINAAKNARLAIIAANAAAALATENKGQTNQLSRQMDGLQTQVTAVAMQTPPPTSPVTPVEFVRPTEPK